MLNVLYALTSHTRMTLSVYPVKRVAPSTDQHRHWHEGTVALAERGGNSGTAEAIFSLLSRSKMAISLVVATAIQ